MYALGDAALADAIALGDEIKQVYLGMEEWTNGAL